MKVIMTKETYSRTDSGKSWRSRPDEVSTSEVTLDNVRKATDEDTLRFFRRLGGWERVDRTYTAWGYLPWRCISISPDRQVKIVRLYDYS